MAQSMKSIAKSPFKKTICLNGCRKLVINPKSECITYSSHMLSHPCNLTVQYNSIQVVKTGKKVTEILEEILENVMVMYSTL